MEYFLGACARLPSHRSVIAGFHRNTVNAASLTRVTKHTTFQRCVHFSPHFKNETHYPGVPIFQSYTYFHFLTSVSGKDTTFLASITRHLECTSKASAARYPRRPEYFTQFLHKKPGTQHLLRQKNNDTTLPLRKNGSIVYKGKETPLPLPLL